MEWGGFEREEQGFCVAHVQLKTFVRDPGGGVEGTAGHVSLELKWEIWLETQFGSVGAVST